MLGAEVLKGAAVHYLKGLVTIGAAGLLAAPTGCTRGGTREPGPQAARMTEHFARANQLWAAVVSGRLDSVRLRAEAILSQETGEGLPARSMPHLDELRAFTTLAVRAPDIESASGAVARVAGACGNCHSFLRRGPEYGATAPPPADTDVASRMQRHRWAADRLWEGLIGPSDEAWRAGAQVLRDAALYTDALTHDVTKYEQVTKLAWTVHENGARSDITTDRHIRADLYGQLLGTCARCHQVLGIN